MNRFRWASLALILSLGVNVLVLGIVIGRGSPLHMFGAIDQRIHHLDPTAGYFAVLRTWPEDRRKIFRPILGEHLQGMRAHFQEMPRLHKDIQRTLKLEPFDPAALETALGKLREHLQVSQEKTHTSLVELAKTMPVDERIRLAREIRQPRKRRGQISRGQSSRGQGKFRPHRTNAEEPITVKPPPPSP